MDSRFLGFFSIRVEGTTIDGEEASTSELDIEVYNENAHEISLYGLDSNVTLNFALGSMVHVPFESWLKDLARLVIFVHLKMIWR